MSQLPAKVGRPRSKLDPNCDTVLIGFKGPVKLKEALEQCAASMGMGYSQFLRAAAQESILRINKVKEGFAK
jgi:hypothetical protein